MKKATMVGWGVFKVEGLNGLWVWDDYPDDADHDGYGVLISGDEMYEIAKNIRDEKDRIVGMELVPFIFA